MGTYYSNGCAANYENTGRCDCQHKMSTIAGIILTTKSTEFATMAGVTEAAIQTLIANKAAWPLWQVGETINNTAEDGVYALPNGLGSIPTSSAVWDITTMFQEGVYSHNVLESFKGFSGRAILIDANGLIWGTSPDGVKFKGFEVKNGQVTNVIAPATNSEVERRGLRLIYSNKDEYRQYRVAIETNWADTLEGLMDVTVEYVSLAAAKTSAIVSVERVCDGSPVTGLVSGDFTLVSDGGDTIEITSVTPGTTSGQYTLAFTALSDDTYLVDMATPATATTYGYESTGADTFTVTTA